MTDICCEMNMLGKAKRGWVGGGSNSQIFIREVGWLVLVEVAGKSGALDFRRASRSTSAKNIRSRVGFAYARRVSFVFDCSSKLPDCERVELLRESASILLGIKNVKACIEIFLLLALFQECHHSGYSHHGSRPASCDQPPPQ
jgi:hypothetical protein